MHSYEICMYVYMRMYVYIRMYFFPFFFVYQRTFHHLCGHHGHWWTLWYFIYFLHFSYWIYLSLTYFFPENVPRGRERERETDRWGQRRKHFRKALAKKKKEKKDRHSSRFFGSWKWWVLISKQLQGDSMTFSFSVKLCNKDYLARSLIWVVGGHVCMCIHVQM